MRFTYLQHIPYRHFGSDFVDKGYEPVVSTPYFELAHPNLVHADLRDAIDELLYAARSGFDAVGLTEHGQSAFDMDPNPNLGAAAVAYAIAAENLDTGICLVGRSLGKSREPLRVAEELGWLDNLSEGRLMTGFSVGVPYDANINAGIPPIETRARHNENLALILEAWRAREPFAWNGKYSQYMKVNVWPRPFQAPHPPVSIAGTGDPKTTRLALEHDFGFNLVGPTLSQAQQHIFDGLWRMADQLGVDDNPFRVNVAQFVVVADTDAEAEKLYAKHIEYSATRGIGAIPAYRMSLPGSISPAELRTLLAGMPTADPPAPEMPSYADLVESGAIVAGSAATVRDILEDRARSYRVGHLMVQLQIGSMPTELVRYNIDLFTAKVIPALRSTWKEYEPHNRWWPIRLGGRPVSPIQSEPTGATVT